MEFIRGRWYKKWINSPEDLRDYNYIMKGFMKFREDLPHKYIEKYSPPELSQSEKTEIYSFWKKYGIKIDDFSYHQMYYHATGIHDPKFVPDQVAGFVLYPYYNDSAYELTWRDKNMFSRLLPNVPMPDTYAKCLRNRFIIGGGYYSRTESSYVLKKLSEHIPLKTDVIVKGSRDSGFGRGVKKYHINDEKDIQTILNDWSSVKNFIIQKCVQQHETLSSLNRGSNNMIRICSWRHENEVDIIYAAARVGIGESATDVVFVNGEEMVNVVGITREGYFRKQKINQDGQFVSDVNIECKIPSWDKIVNIIKQNHLLIDNFDIVGWDFTIDNDANPICFEWNIQWPGTVLYQYANGPLFGEYIEKILSFLKEEKNQYNYIPSFMRIV